MLRKYLCSLLLILIFPPSFAAPLPAEQAFVFSSSLEKDQLVLHWKMAPGYYLYREKLKLLPTDPNQIKTIELPKGEQRHNQILGNYQAYFDELNITVPVVSPHGVLTMTIGYQGCSAQGFCYSPVKKQLTVDLDKLQFVTGTLQKPETKESEVLNLLEKHNPFWIILSFLGLGILLAFTPCVFPMIPILSSIIVKQGKNISAIKGLCLSFFYVLGMAVSYALAGMLFALLGSHIQIELQKTWVIVLFSLVFIALALSLFGWYRLQLPKWLRQRLVHLSDKPKKGAYLGVFLMGGLSSLILSPCVTPPLVGVLLYVAQTGNWLLGAMALFFLGIGMGVPLLLIGISAGKLLPKAGVWMTAFEKLFGIILLGAAIWMLSRVIPGPLALCLWGALFMMSGIYCYFAVKRHYGLQGTGLVALVYGIILLVGASLGNSDPLHPWENTHLQKEQPAFILIRNSMELQKAFLQAKQQKKPIILDFYADWCVSCVKMDREVFNQPKVQQALQTYMVLRADITANTPFDQSLLERFHLIAPPSMLFFNAEGVLVKQMEGEVDAEAFLKSLHSAP